jgi:hypothetical protein
MTSDYTRYEIGESQFFAGPARIYISQDNLHRVILPENLGVELDAITEFKKIIGMDIMSSTVSFYCIPPEQIFEEIRKLPDPQLIKEVILKDSPKDEDNAVLVEEERATFCPSGEGRIILFSPLTPNELQPILLEHWASLNVQSGT